MTTLYQCTVCGRVGVVGRCCGDETRVPLNEEAMRELAKQRFFGDEWETFSEAVRRTGISIDDAKIALKRALDDDTVESCFMGHGKNMRTLWRRRGDASA